MPSKSRLAPGRHGLRVAHRLPGQQPFVTVVAGGGSPHQRDQIEVGPAGAQPLDHLLVIDAVRCGSGGVETALRQVPMRRTGEPADTAAAAVFLASEQARYITGATLPVDGGWSAFGGSGHR